ncbi:MarR family winged helix-turn-helix transcriptional regulator [Pseudonocardia sp. HH130630-07]|uniref:MarR family winged helix-turn-helix transcriptional regulator n=1 Tax=Pseudonocardia sp. HH130630-07 TaxID=1690815 RepID=UPI0008153CD9|nr:MarR family transcriptional regulator [Pseudonocardia sp. HH130630-07]ANY05956.1 MarR family transcriptional regulator [Pseudonocardia sp. HH130630-07]
MSDTVGAPGRDCPGRRPELPTHDEMASWRTFLRAHAGVTRMLESELEAEQKLSLAAYDVLVQLSEAPEHRLRMTELAEAVLLSRSGVTRLVDRLERSGLVLRAKVAEDGRGVTATLTDAGQERLRIASTTHLRGVRRHFADRLDPADLAELARISRKLIP